VEGPSCGRLLVHAALFVATGATLVAAGALFWSESVGGAVAYAGWTAAILLAHELGHYAACRAHGVRASLPYFIPGVPPVGTFGALIRIRGPIPDRRALFDIAAAGPFAGFVVALGAFAIGMARAEPFEPGPGAGTVVRFGQPAAALLLRPWWAGDDSGAIAVNAEYGAGWVGMLVTSLNLFPVGQLDGGHAAYAVSARLHRVLSWTTPFVLAIVVAHQAVVEREAPAYLIWIAILLWMRARHPPLLHAASPLGPARKLLALLLALLFALSFMAAPIRIVDLEPDGEAGAPREQTDGPVAIGPQYANATRAEGVERLTVRVAEGIRAPGRGDRHNGRDRREERVARCVAAAVVAQDERFRAHRLAARDHRRLLVSTGVSRDEDPLGRGTGEHDDRAPVLVIG
jgi:hypothetical protein